MKIFMHLVPKFEYPKGPKLPCRAMCRPGIIITVAQIIAGYQIVAKEGIL